MCIILVAAGLMAAFSLGKAVGTYSSKTEKIKKLIEYFFPFEYDEVLVEDAAARFMVMALNDPYSVYMSKEETEIFEESINGEYKGIGITMLYDEEKDCIFVTDVAEGSPAYTAGVKAGDIPLSVDELAINYENYDRVYYYIKGISAEAPSDNTPMELKVKRGQEELSFMVKRTELLYESVTAKEEDGILYIKLTEFSKNSAVKFKEEIEKHSDAKGIILDLNDNGGGDLDSLIEIAELLLPEGVLLITEEKDGARYEYNIKDNEYCDAPLVVLVNGNTASASEVLAAAVKERDRGILVGETTYGKGLVQAIFPMGDGSAVRLTVEKYYTAGGNYINGVGVEPDVQAEDEVQIERAREYIEEILK